jgi:UPF0755 protein
MRLQCDPTVIYALTQGKELFARSLTKTDLKTESPFNTYRVQGLPPAPICNPGKASLLAAFSPLKTDELYFVLKKGREHEFSHSLINHNKAVQNLRRLEKGNTQ